MTDEQRHLVEANLPLVWSLVSKRYKNVNLLGGFEDMVQIGSVGLCKAATTYRPELGYTFSTYASRCIINEIKMAIRTQLMSKRTGSTVPLETPLDSEGATLMEFFPDPNADVDQIMDLKHTQELLQKAFDDDPILLEVATGHMTQQEAADLLEVSQPTIHRRVQTLKKLFNRKEE